MKILSQDQQLEMMETVAASCGTNSYDVARELMFDAFNAEYGKGKWTFEPIEDQRRAEFEEWLAEEEDY